MSNYSISQRGFKISQLAAIIASASISCGAQAVDTYRINVGGDKFTDVNGKTWLADTGFNTGTLSGSGIGKAIAGTQIDKLYQQQRYDTPDGPELKYSFDAPNGTYDIKLHFAETYSGAFGNGKRVFDVFAEGTKRLAKFDIYAAAGAGNRAVVRRLSNVEVTDGKLDIQFGHLVQNPMLAGIEIIPVSLASETPAAETVTEVVTEVVTETITDKTVIKRINAGGEAYTDVKGNLWSADQGFTSGRVSTRGVGDAIAGTQDDTLYGIQRMLPAYAFKVPNGEYEVKIHMAETYEGCFGDGLRVFNIAAEGQTGIKNNDTYREAGSEHRALVKTISGIQVKDGVLNLDFQGIVQNPQIAALEIIQVTERTVEKVVEKVVETVVEAAPAVTIRVNAGGEAYTDAAGNVWAADHGFLAGYVSTRGKDEAFAGTQDDTLFQLQRRNPKYQFPVPNGEYKVTLHFAETHEDRFAVNERVFNVFAEDTMSATPVDPFKDAGGKLRASSRVLPSVVVMDGKLDLRFEAILAKPEVAAIEIVSVNVDSAAESTDNTDTTNSGSTPTTDTDTASNDSSSSTDTSSSGNTYVFVGISDQPDSVSVRSGGSASFSITAKASHEMSFQWYKNGQALSGANSSTLTLNNVSSSDAGNYTCTVSAGGKSVTSTAAALDVIAPTNARLSWAAPTVRADGTTLRSGDIASYEVYHSTSSADRLSLLAKVNADQLSYEFENLSSGTHYFAIATIDVNGTKSSLSDRVSVNID